MTDYSRFEFWGAQDGTEFIMCSDCRITDPIDSMTLAGLIEWANEHWQEAHAPAPVEADREADAEVFQRVLAGELDKAQRERREQRWADMRASDRARWGLCGASRPQQPPLPALWCDLPADHAGDHHWCVA